MKFFKVVLPAALLSAGLVVSAGATCRDGTVEFRVEDSDTAMARFTVEVADDWEEVSRGLMHRESMSRSAGMLFVYPEPGPVAFWMKNTLIPLDMIFIGPDGVVDRVHANAKPLDETTIPGGDDIQYVLEINGGLAAMLGIEPGVQLRHPAVDPDLAAWPCE